MTDRPNRTSVLRFASVMAGVTAVVWLIFRDAVMGSVLVGMRTLTAQVSNELIQLVGMEAYRHGTAVYHTAGAFAFEISRGCTAFVGAVLIAAGIAAYPTARPRSRLPGVALGVSAFLVINQLRLIHLFYLGVHAPDRFHVVHEVWWQMGMAAAVLGIWLAWVAWADAIGRGRGRRVRLLTHQTPDPSTVLTHQLR